MSGDEKMVSMTPEELKKLIDTEKKKAVAEAKRKEQKVVNNQRKMQVSHFMSISGLTDSAFCEKLMKWHVQPEWATCLREGHASLDRPKVYKYMRDHYIRPKKMH